MIYNNKVNLHLYDSGLLTIPFEYCVSRNINNEYFIDDIPEQIEEISVDSMDSIELTQKENTNFQKLKNKFDKLRQENIELKKLNKDNSKINEKNVNDLAKMDVPSEAYDDRDNIYISCIFDKISTTYIFNASEESFKLINKLDVVTYEVSFNDAYIVATNEALELTINRVTGKAALQGSIIIKGMCNLADKTKF